MSNSVLTSFDAAACAEMIARINRLTPASTAQWGKMSVDQMLAHCNVTYEMVYTDKHPPAGAFKRFLLNLFVKNAVVGPKPYARNTPTAPQFKMAGVKDFEPERSRLIDYITRVQREGASAFEGRQSNSFGALTAAEWNTMFSKHLEHHLAQFGV